LGVVEGCDMKWYDAFLVTAFICLTIYGLATNFWETTKILATGVVAILLLGLLMFTPPPFI
jgi:hypothetical protein